MKNNFHTGAQAREKLMNGIKQVAQIVGATMGTSGSNVLLETLERPGFFSGNDGYTAANALHFEDPIEELGKKIILEAINRANKSSGDGSSTTCVLTSAILEEGMKHIGETSPMELKRSLEDCIPLVEASIKNQKKEITVDEVGSVASISAEDEEIGNRIQEIYQQIGPTGVIHWDISKTPEDSYALGSGITIHGATYVSPYMCDIDEGGSLSGTVRWKNPLMLMCRGKLTAASDFNTLFQDLDNKGKRELLIFCDDIEIPVIADLVKTRAIRGFKSVVVKMPVLWRDEWWEDIALASGATVIDGLSGVGLREAKLEHLGTVGHLTITKEDTFIDGIKDLSEHINKLQEEGTDANLIRASRLNTKTARYFVGGYSESGIAYRRLKVEDAINASSCALESGVVVGGGLALKNASESLPDTVGGRVLRVALKAPLKCIIRNSGWNPKEEKEENWGPKDLYINGMDFEEGRGWNTKEQRVGNMLEMGIIDPASVVTGAMRNAIGVASGILSTGNVILFPKEENHSILQRDDLRQV